MRYRVGADGLADQSHPALDLGTSTVVATFVVGLGLIAIGIRGHQRWLVFWGTVTCACCVLYLVRGWLGLPNLA